MADPLDALKQLQQLRTAQQPPPDKGAAAVTALQKLKTGPQPATAPSAAPSDDISSFKTGATGSEAQTPPQLSYFDPQINLSASALTDPFQIRIWDRTETDQEKIRFLEQGKRDGKWKAYNKYSDVNDYYVTLPNGKNVPITGGMSNIGAQVGGAVMAHPFEIAGQIGASFVPEAKVPEIAAGELAGKPLMEQAKALWDRFWAGTSHNIGRAALTGTGAATGKMMDEIQKTLEGQAQPVDPLEKAMRIARAAAGGFTAEMGVRTPMSAIDVARQGLSKFIRPDIQALTKQVLEEGGRPTVEQATGGVSKLFPWEQMLMEKIFHPGRRANIQFTINRIKRLLMDAGHPPHQAHNIAEGFRTHPDIATDPTRLTEQLKAGAQTRIARSQAGVETAQIGLEKDLSKQLAGIEKDMASPDPQLQQKVQEDISAARTNFANQAERQYSAADAAEGDEPTVPSQGIMDTANGIIDQIQKTAATPGKADPMAAITGRQPGMVPGKPVFTIPEEIRNLTNLPPKITLARAARLKSALMSWGRATNLTPGIEEHQWTELGKAVDRAMASADLKSKAARDARKAADDFYSKGIKRFQQLSVRQLGKQAELTNFADPEKVASQVLRQGFSAQGLRIKELVSPATWKQVGNAFWGMLTKDASVEGLAGDHLLDGKKFLDAVTKAGKNLDVAYGSAKAAEIRQLAQRMAAVGGKMDVSKLSPDNFKLRVGTYLRAKAQHDQMLEQNYVQMLSGRSGKDLVDALDYVMEDPRRVEKVKQFYGPDSTEFKSIQQQAMLKFLKDSFTPGVGVLEALLEPGKLSGRLNQMNPAVMDNLFGPDVGHNLRELGRVIDFVAAPPLTLGKGIKGAGFAGALAAGGIMFSPIAHLPLILKLGAGATLYRSAPFIRWLTLGLQGDTRAMRNARRLAQAVAYTYEPSSDMGEPLFQLGKTAVEQIGSYPQPDPTIKSLRGKGAPQAGGSAYDTIMNMLKPGGGEQPDTGGGDISTYGGGQ